MRCFLSDVGFGALCASDKAAALLAFLITSDLMAHSKVAPLRFVTTTINVCALA